MTQAVAPALGIDTGRNSKTLDDLAREYDAVRGATRAAAPFELPDSRYDHSVVGLAYRQLKNRNRLAYLVNRALRRAALPNRPLEIQFNSIGFCNMQCPQCSTHGTEEAHSKYNAKSMTMPAGVVEKIAAETMPYAEHGITSGLGEGLTHKKGVQIIAKHARRYGTKIFTNSNGIIVRPHIVGQLYGVSELRLSVDGATPVTYETHRIGGKFSRVMRNIMVIELANRRLPQQLRLEHGINFGISASNTRDMPVMVDLCAFLGIRFVQAFRLEPQHPKFLDDDILKYPAYYKHYYLQAHQRARGRDMHLALPEPDPAVAPDPGAGPNTNVGMMAPALDDSYYVKLPEFERLIDIKDIEDDVEETVREALQSGIERHAAAHPAAVREAMEDARQREHELTEAMKDVIGALPPEEIQRLRTMHTSERLVPHCQFLLQHLNYNPGGEVLPCCTTRVSKVGDISQDPVSIFRGPGLREFLDAYRAEQPPAVCRECSFFRMVPEREVLPIPLFQ